MKLTWLFGLAAVMVGLVASTGCSDGGDPDPSLDAGVPDSGMPTTDRDAGGIFLPDGGPADSGVPPCPTGTEGCPCDFAIDDCEDDLVCVPWDLAAGISPDDPNLSGPVQTCVQPCADDDDCGDNDDGSPRRCAETFFAESSGVSRICVDELAEVDEFCGFSRLSVSRVRGIDRLGTPGRMVGCSETELCVPFGVNHLDEGFCLDLCLESADCEAPTPYCNPLIPTDTPTVSLGICSTSQKGVGALCGTADPNKAGYTELCDGSSATPDNTICLLGGDVGLVEFEGRLGICSTLCNDAIPCTAVDPVLGPTSCSEPYLSLVPGQPLVGVCNTGCTEFPETCGGTGALAAGRQCTELEDIVNMCVDIVPPTLAVGEFDNTGTLNVDIGDDCLAESGAASVSCPAGTQCIFFDAPDGTLQGRCLFGCRLGESEICDTLLNTSSSTCAAVLTSTVNGICRSL